MTPYGRKTTNLAAAQRKPQGSSMLRAPAIQPASLPHKRELLRKRIRRHLNQLHIVHLRNRRSLRRGIGLTVINRLHAMRAQRLHAGRTRHRRTGHHSGFASLEQTAQIDLRMQHELLPLIARLPELLLRIEPRKQTVIRSPDHAVILIQSRRSHLAVRIFGTKSGHMGQSHHILGNTDTGHNERKNWQQPTRKPLP